MKRALIIGGSGGLSGVLAAGAQKEYDEVYVLTRGVRPVGEGLVRLTADRNDEAAFSASVLGAGVKFDTVFDCICMNERHAKQDIDVIAQVTDRLVVVSTDSVYDSKHKRTPQNEDGIFIEDEGGIPALGYAAGKRRMERVFEAYMQSGNCAHEGENAENNGETASKHMRITIFRPGHIYGPGFKLGCFPEHSRQDDLIGYIKAGKPLYLVGMGTYIIQPIYVDDLAETMLDCADKPGAFDRFFCIGGPEAIENRRYYEILAEVLGTKAVIKEIPLEGYMEAHPEYYGHLCHRIYDLSALKAAGVKLPSTDVRTGMSESIQKRRKRVSLQLVEQEKK